MSARSMRSKTTTEKRNQHGNENLNDRPEVSTRSKNNSRKSAAKRGLHESVSMNFEIKDFKNTKVPGNKKPIKRHPSELSHDRDQITVKKLCHGPESHLACLPECFRQKQENDLVNSAKQGKRGLSLVDNGRSLLHQLYRKTLGSRQPFTDPYQEKLMSAPVKTLLKDMKLYRTASPFDRRCTALEWHPKNPAILAVASKGGDIIIWNTEAVEKDIFIEGSGAGGSVQAMKFWPHTSDQLMTASIDGTVTLHDLEGKQSHALLDTLDSTNHWFCSLDVSDKLNALAAGDNSGFVTLRTLNGENVWRKRLHKNKVTHIEFSPREPWLMCSASLEHAVKLWDIRMIKDKTSAVITLPHEKGVNSAYFNHTDGTKLLTTDQYREIRIYSLPNGLLERTIQHPHRFFRHITPIKAEWHPLQDLIVVGRYPENGFPGYVEGEKRTVDMFDAGTGDMICQLHDPAAPGLISLNKFSHQGDKLASCMGVNILIWNRQEVLVEKQAKLMKSLEDVVNTPSTSRNPDSAGRRASTAKKSAKEKSSQTKTKTASKTKQSKK